MSAFKMIVALGWGVYGFVNIIRFLKTDDEQLKMYCAFMAMISLLTARLSMVESKLP